MGYADYQKEIYIVGQNPLFTTRVSGLQRLAEAKLPSVAYNYVAGSASAERTYHANLSAFDRWRIVPRMLRDNNEPDISVELFGRTLPTPLLLAPVGVMGMCHPDGEEAVARAAADQEIPMILSNAASRTIEQVADASGDNERWFQLYWPSSDDVTVSYLQRARASGYRCLVVTLDTITIGYRPSDLDQAYLPFLKALGTQIGMSDPAFMGSLGREPLADGNVDGLSDEEIRELSVAWISVQFPGLFRKWEDLALLRNNWDGPILLKGIVSVEDARLASKHGMDGIIVSNHGGRQVDGARSALDALAAITADRQVQTSGLTVLFDSGIRSGADMIKALALGAKAVCIGRPYMYGLALEGEDGVTHVLRSLLADFENSFSLAGFKSIKDLNREALDQMDAQVPQPGFMRRMWAKL